MKFIWFTFSLLLFMKFPLLALGQAEDAAAEEEAEAVVKTVLGSAPFISARASGLGGAMSTISNGSEAVYYNPAGIGGLHLGSKKMPSVRNFHFPYVGASANENAQKLNEEFSDQGGVDDRGVGQAIVEANEGKRQYARVSYLMDLAISRTILITYSDIQAAAVKTVGETPDEGSIALQYRSQSGTGFGFSATDSKETFYLGVFSSYNTRSDLDVENVDYLQIINVDNRKALLAENTLKWSGISSNVGMLWVFEKHWKPTLGIVARDVGDSKYKLSKAPDSYTGEEDELTIKQDITAGFSISPRIGKDSYFNFILEGYRLTDEDVTLRKKIRTGMELTFSGFGSDAAMGIRGGYNSAGASFGLSLNLELIQIEVASEAVDIGVENNSIIDRRNVAVFSVNVSEK